MKNQCNNKSKKRNNIQINIIILIILIVSGKYCSGQRNENVYLTALRVNAKQQQSNTTGVSTSEFALTMKHKSRRKNKESTHTMYANALKTRRCGCQWKIECNRCTLIHTHLDVQRASAAKGAIA